MVIAEEQTAGRGKPGSSWFSPSGSGIYLSAILEPRRNPAELAPITLVGARAIVKLISQAAGLKATIKAPNDVLVGGKKICGILTERLASGKLIIGLGLNVNNEASSFPRELKDKATSLIAETGRNFSLTELAADLLQLLDREYLAYLQGI